MSLIRVPDDFSVWAFADPHGVRSGLAASLQQAGLIDSDEHWKAAAKTALVGCGDYIDRGRDSKGVLDLLFRLRDEAAAAGSLVVLAKGNHEAVLESTLRGIGSEAAAWLSDFFGGVATAESLGLSAGSRALGRSARDIAIALRDVAPELPGRLRSMPDAILWRDVMFCHAGPPPGYGPEDLGTKTTDHLWEFPDFHRKDLPQYDLEHADFARYRDAGITRFVFGHQSYEGPEVFQGGAAMSLDTNPTGGAPGIRTSFSTLAHIPKDGSLLGAACVLVDTTGALDGAGPSRR